MEPVKTAKGLADLRAELTVEEAWAEAVETEVVQVAIRTAMAALARAEDAAAVGETAGAVRAELDMARLAQEAALKAPDRATEAIEAAARRRRSHDMRAGEK